MPRFIRNLIGNRDGVTILEFAFVVPLLMLTVLGVMEIGMILFASSLLEGGMRTAARFGITGYAPAGVSREDRVRQILGENLAGLVAPEDVTFVQTVYPNFTQVGQPEPYTDDNPANGTYDAGETFVDINGNGQWDADMGLPGVGGPGDVVVYTATVQWRLLTPFLTAVLGEGGRMPLSASIVVRNEPFGSS